MFRHHKRDGVALIIPTTDALDNWQQQSKELAAKLKKEREE